ncbi:ribonuclease E/G [Clostridium sp. DL1XJH146]
MEEIYIERENELLTIAIKKDNKLQEVFFEEDKDEPTPGKIYLGVIKEILPSAECIFIDIGFEKNAYMNIKKKKYDNLKKGSSILVEVMKEKDGDKGPKVTAEVTIAGRYAVLLCNSRGVKFSKNLGHQNIFKKYVQDNINKSDNIGVMIRTNAINVDITVINKEISSLYDKYCELVKEAKYKLKPGVLYDGGGIIGRIIKDILTSNTNKLVTNNKDDYRIIEEFSLFKGDLDFELIEYIEQEDLLSYYNIDKEILSLRHERVFLKSGGNIVIQKTEAMYVIDVNTASNISGKNIGGVAIQTNIEAAEEIPKQIMLRNLGGIIVIDFIENQSKEESSRIVQILKNGFKDDKKKTLVYFPTSLNLVQIARKKRGKTIYDYLEDNCIACRGKGKKLKLQYIKRSISNQLTRISYKFDVENIYVELNEIYKEEIQGDILSFIISIGAIDKQVYINYLQNYESIKVEALIFASQIKKIEHLKVYGDQIE